MRTRLVVFGVVGSLLSLSAWGAQITYYIDERGRRVYINAEEPPKKPAATPKPKRSTRHSVLVREDPRTRQVVPVPAPPEQFSEVPSGETRGRFAISPEPNPATGQAEPGSKVETPPTAG